MAQYRGVFIAPPTINKHRRSKTYPQKTSREPQHKSEIAHLPRWESFSPRFTQGAPSIPCLLKEVTLEFRSGKKRETSNYELPCTSFPKKLKDNKFESPHPRDGVRPSDSVDLIYHHPHEPFGHKLQSLVLTKNPGSIDQGEDSIDATVSCDKTPETERNHTERTHLNVNHPEDRIQVPPEKKALTFGKTVYPNGFERENNLDFEDPYNTSQEIEAITTNVNDKEVVTREEIPGCQENFTEIQCPDNSSHLQPSDLRNCPVQEFQNRTYPVDENQNLVPIKEHRISGTKETPERKGRLITEQKNCDSHERTQEAEKFQKLRGILDPLTRSSQPQKQSLRRLILVSENEVLKETIEETEKQDQLANDNRDEGIAHPLKVNVEDSSFECYQNKRGTYAINAQQEAEVLNELVTSINPTAILENTCFVPKIQELNAVNAEREHKPSVENTSAGEAKIHQVPQATISSLRGIPVEIQGIKRKAYKGPIVFHFDNTLVVNKEVTEESCFVNRVATTPTTPDSTNVSPRCLFSNSDDCEPTFVPISPKFTSTPISKKEVAQERSFDSTLDIQDNSEFDFEKQSLEDLSDFETMASQSYPGPSVRANKALWESRETIRQLEEKLLNEQKISENKERTIQSLKKEVKKMEGELDEGNTNNENLDDIKSKLSSMETENRILLNQVKMVEEANKKLYKELYETKTQLRFQERRSDDVGMQNAHTGRRLSQVLQSSIDKNTGFTVFLHQMETNLISTESVLRKLRAQRQALEDVLKEDEKVEVSLTFPFIYEEKASFLTEEIKSVIRAQFEKSLECNFADAESKQAHCDERIEDLENIINDCMESKFTNEKDKLSANQKKIDLARVHVKALKDMEGKCMEIKQRTEDQIANMKGRVSDEVKEISKEISAVYLAKQERKGKPRRKIPNIDSPQAIRKKSVDEIADIDRALRSMKSKSKVTCQGLSEDEKEIIFLNEKMSKTLDNQIQLSEELLETQSKIQELENRYDDKQQETEKLEKELSMKRKEISEMAKEMQIALSNISPENVTEGLKRQSSDGSWPTAEHVEQTEEKEVQIDDMKEELVHTILLLETEQKERQEALRMNEDLFLELENREQEIASLLMELEHLKGKDKIERNMPQTCKMLNELLSSIEPNKAKEELVQLQKEIEEEMTAKEKEFAQLSHQLSKQKEESDMLLTSLDYYKDEMSKLQQEKLAKSYPIIATASQPEGDADHEKLPFVEKLGNEVKKGEEIIRKLEDDVSDLQSALATEIDANEDSREKVADLEESLRKEKQAKEYAYKHNKELEEELRIKDTKLKNFASTVGIKKNETLPNPIKGTKPESSTTIADLRAAMAQIQSEKEDLATEVDNLASAMEGKENIDDQNRKPEQVNSVFESDIQKQTEENLHSEVNDFFSDELDGWRNIEKDSKDDDKKIGDMPQQNEAIKAKEKPLTHLAAKNDKSVQKMEQTIKTLEKEVDHLRSENTHLENEAADVMDDGLKVENKILRNQVNSLTNELAISRADEDDMKREFEHVESRSKDLQEALVNITAAKNELEYSSEGLTFQNKILHQELELVRRKIEVLEEERKVIAGENIGIDAVDSKVFLQENETLKTEIAKITLDLNVNKEEAKRLHDELEVSEGAVKELEVQLTSLQKEKASLEIMADDLSFQNKTQEKEMKLLKKKITVLEEEIHLVEKDLNQRSDEVKEKEDAMQKLLEDNATKQSERQELENELKKKENAYEASKIAEETQLKHLSEKNFNLQAQLNKFKMDSTESKQEQQRLEKDLNELRDRLREADRKFKSTKDDRMKTEDTLSVTKSRAVQLQKELADAKTEVKEKNDVIRKLNLKNSELQITLAEREEELRREGKLRMDNMKLLDALKIKMEKMETDDKKKRDRLFSLKSACSEANEAYEIVKRQNLNLRNDMQGLKKKFNERGQEVESNKREKEKLEEQILNASRTIDDIRKYSARDESLSPDSALGISVSSLTELCSGPDSPNSDTSDSLFTAGEEELKFMPQEQHGLLCKMPTMIENFRAVVRDNDLMKNKILEMMTNKDKMSSQLQHYSTLSDDLQKEVGDKDRFLGELQSKARMLEDELNDTKSSLYKIDRDFAATASEADLIKTTLKVREETVVELREKVELLEEKEKALDLYSKSVSEKYQHEAMQRQDFESLNHSLNDKNRKQKILLGNLEKKLSEYSSRPRRVSEPEVKSVAVVQIQEQIPKKKTSEVAMATLEEKLDSIVMYSEVLESSLTDVEIGYRSLQAENDRLQREMVTIEEFESLKTNLEQQEKSFKEQEETLHEQINDLETQKDHLVSQKKDKSESMSLMIQKEQETLQEHQKLKESFAPMHDANLILKADIQKLKEDAKQTEELRVKLETDLQFVKTKMCEMEMTTEAYKDENSKLRNDIIALSEEKCEEECKVSAAERREKKLNDLINQERAERDELRAEHETALSMCDSLQGDLTRAKENITSLETEQDKTQQSNNEMESKLNDITNQKGHLGDKLQLARKDLNDLEDRYRKTVDQEELLSQKLNKLRMENSRLVTAYEQSQKRKNDVERELIEANGKNEDFEAELERIRIEKAGLLKEIVQKEEMVEIMESKKSELEEERQKLTNDLYLSTRKVLSLQLNLESLRNDVTQLGRELRRLVLGAVGREARGEAEEKSMEADLEMSLFENEVVVQALRQTIKATERSLDLIRPEAKVSELENKLCHKDIDSVHREFAFLKDQLSSFRHSCQKLSDETKRLKEDVNIKEVILQDTREQNEALKEENTENKENILQLQGKCSELDFLTAEYEQNIETAHSDMVRANQTIASLEASLTKSELKKNGLDKERLVMQERLNNLESNQRASKDEIRSDKKRIASLEVEHNENQGLARDLEKVESNLNELKLKYDDALKDREETKAELASVREELRQEDIELKNFRKEAENFKKHIVIEREMRQRVEQDLNEHVEELKTYKKSLHALQRAHSKLQDANETLSEKSKLLEETGQTFKKQLEVQYVEMKRLRDSLTDTRNELLSTNERYEGVEKERKRLTEDLVHAEEQVKKLQDTCNELLREKCFATDKVGSLSDTLDVMISSHEDIINNLKQDLMVTNKDLSVTKSSLERNQKRNEELLRVIKNQEVKMKAMEEKKKDIFEKFWESQNQLSEAQSCIDSFKAETKDLKGRVAIHLSKIEQLEDALEKEHDENEKTIETLNDKLSALKTQGNGLFQERDMLEQTLEQTEDALNKTSEELKQTTKTLAEKEKLFVAETKKRDIAIDELKNISEEQRGELRKTKEMLRDVCRENCVLKETLETTEKTLEVLESKVDEQENNNVDALAEAQAKLNVISKMEASNSGEHFVELQSAPLLSADFESFDKVDGLLDSSRETSIKDVVDAFHQTCMSSFGVNRDLQDTVVQVNEDNANLEESLNKERNIMAETKRYLHETEKKKTKLEEEVKRLRRRLETFKQKSIELERTKDDELCELNGERVMLNKENWALKEEVEELKAKSKETKDERNRYADDLNATQKHVVEAREDIRQAQEQLDSMQEQLFDMKKRTFELEAREKSLQQQNREKEKELYANQMKSEELEKLYDNANHKKTVLFSQMSKAEDKIRNQEFEREENEVKGKEMGQEIETLLCNVSELQLNLGEVAKEAEEAKDKIEELEIQRGSLQASNEILKHRLELSFSESEALKSSYVSTHDESLNLSRALNEVTINKETLQTELKCLSQEKERLQEALNTSDSQLHQSEDNLVKTFQEGENLKRELLKVQSAACAESVKLQAEFAKMKCELESTKKETSEKAKDYTGKVIKLKGMEKEMDSLKKELNDTRMRDSELKLDYTTASSKLQSYVLERECWEREVKTVLGEIEQQKNVNATKEHRLERLRMRYEQEIGFLSQRVSSLERELKVVQDASEQQRHADDIAHKLNIESKEMEIDNLRIRLQATHIHASDKNTVVDQMKNQLDDRTSQITDLMNQMGVLKDSYRLELASVQADLKCSQMENLLKLRKDMESDNQLSTSHDSVSDLLAAIKASRNESERLRHLLGSRMRQMNSLNKDISSKRTHTKEGGARSYGLYNRDNEGHLSVD